MSDPTRLPGLSTLAVHGGSPGGANAPLTAPIVQATTFRFESAEQVFEYARGGAGEAPLYMYGRDENPTVRAPEQAGARPGGGQACAPVPGAHGGLVAARVGPAATGG